MEAFMKHTGLVAPLDRVNVDTDQMVPKQFLKLLYARRIWRSSYFTTGDILPGEKPNPEFVLNFAALQRRERASCAGEFWLRVEPRACAVGDSWIMAFARFSRRATRIFSTTIASRTGFCPSR